MISKTRSSVSLKLFRESVKKSPSMIGRILENQNTEFINTLLASTEDRDHANLIISAPQSVALKIIMSSKVNLSKICEIIDPAIVARNLLFANEQRRNEVIKLLPRSRGSEISQILNYPPDTAGSLMNIRVASFPPDTTVSEAVNKLKTLKGQKIVEIYIVDKDKKLRGFTRA